MKRLFGSKKAETRAAQPVPPAPLDLGAVVAKTEERVGAFEAQLKPLDEDIKALYAKMKATTVLAEKQYVKSRLAQKLLKRSQLLQQLNRSSNRLGLISTLQGNMQGVRDMAETAELVKGSNEALKRQVAGLDFDALRENIDDMNELGAENDAMVREMNEQFNQQADDDIEEQLANIENELALQELLPAQGGQAPAQYNPLKF